MSSDPLPAGQRDQPGAESVPWPVTGDGRDIPRWIFHVLDTIDDAFIMLDREWRFVYLNRSALEQAREPMEKLLGRSIWDLYPELLGTPVEINYRRAMAEQTTVRFEMPGVFTDRWLDIHAYPMPEGLFICARDGTQRKRAAEALRESELRFQAFMDNSPAVAWMKDEQLRFVYVNRPWEKRFQKKLEELRGLSDLDMRPPEVGHKLRAHDRLVLSSGTTREFEETVPDPDGQIHHWRVFKFPFADSSGRKYVGGMAIDISEHKAAADNLRAYAERMALLSRRLFEAQEAERRHLARELHDEIGQLLTGLQLFLEAAERRQAGGAETDSNPQRLVKELMRRVRELSLDLRPSILDDLGLVPALTWQFKRYTERTGIQVAFEHQDVNKRFPPDLETAAFRIVQEALTNVARHANVRKAWVRLWLSGPRLWVQVVDEGTGFDPNEVAEGSSSGLSGMRERAALLDGLLTVHSHPGVGTRLTAELPLGRDADQPA
jgi:PAS domain S-box-containing protein